MPTDARRAQLDLYEGAHAQLVETLQQYPREMWAWRATPDAWSIHDVVVHIADSEANSYVRARKLIAEPGSTIAAYDESGWVGALDYAAQSADDALELFRLLRAATYRLVRRQPDEVWSHTIEHPENGTMTMDDWLRVYAAHIPDHLRQIQGIYREWVAARQEGRA